MVVLLVLLALTLIATGGAAIVFGAPIVQVERGWTMVISGSVSASAGFLLLGIALVALRLGRVARELVVIRDRLGSVGESLEEATIGAGGGEVAPRPTPAASPPAVPPPAPLEEEPVIVGQYQSGGNSYVMYSDGSVQADTPSGRHRFASLDELRSFVGSGG